MSDGFKGIQILVIDAFEDRTGEVNKQAFRKCVLKCLSDCGVVDPLLIHREVNKLEDYCIDWEHDLMDDSTKVRAKTFDKLDLILVGGDLGIMPWSPLCMQLVTLFNMANKVNKPVMCVGSATLTYIYALSTSGLRFNVLNQPLGGLLRDLPSFGTYTLGAGTYPGGYLGNEVGDIYTYDPERSAWRPRCNIGVHFSGGAAVTGLPMPPKNFVSRERRAEPTLMPDSSVANIRPSKQQHYCLKHLNQNYFPYTQLKDWLINNEGGLPAVTSSSLQIIAESYSGPVLLAKGNAVLLASIVKDSGSSYEATFKLMLGWMSDVLGRLKVNPYARIDKSIYDFLFSNVSSKPGAAFSIDATSDRPISKTNYETVKERDFYTCSPALTSVSYRSSIPGGPKLLVTPVFNMYFPQVTENAIDYGALQKQGKQPPSGVMSNTNIPLQTGLHGGKGVVHIMRNPAMQTDIRVKALLDKGGYSKSIKVFNKIKDVDARDRGDCVADPDLTAKDKELIAGRILDSKNIFSRRCQSPDTYGIVDDLKVLSPEAGLDDIRSVFSDEKNAAPGISRLKVGVNINLSKHPRGAKVKNIEVGKNIKGKYDAATGKIVQVSSKTNLNVKFALDDNVVSDRSNVPSGGEASQSRPKSALLSKMVQECFLPLHQPAPESRYFTGLDKIASNNTFSNDVVRLSGGNKPAYFFNSLENNDSEYKGYYKDGIVFRTPYEQQIKEDFARNEAALFGAFKNRHDKASRMQVRPVGLVGPQSAYTDPENRYIEVPKIPGGSTEKMFGSWK